MRRIRFGRTEMMVSAVGFGGIPIGRLDVAQAQKVIRRCYELGVNFFDTAHAYPGSEDKIGRALSDVRAEVIYATKSSARDEKTSREHLELSLEQLRTDYIDLFQLHNVSTEDAYEKAMAPGGSLQMAKKAQERGIIRHVGITCHNLDLAERACRTGEFASVQVPFSIVEHDPVERLFPAARELDMGILAMKPFGGGLMQKAELCMGFLQQYPYVLPIPGIQATDEIEEIAGLYESPKGLDDAARQEIEDIRKELGGRFCHRCEYCQPCPEGVRVPMVLLFKAIVQRSTPERALTMAKPHMESALNCVFCRECEEKCPYELPVADMVAEMLEAYKEFKALHPEAEA